MNTRIQVEHTVTEMVTGLDLVREQVLIAAGEPLSLRQEDVRCTGMRSSAGSTPRTSRSGFLPAPGTITRYREPAGPGVRVDSGVVAGSEISPLYDPMIAKLVVHGVDREHARRRMLRALDEFVDRGSEDADRLSQGAADAAVLRRGRDVPRPRRVRAARRTRRGVVKNETTVGAADRRRPPCVRAPVEVEGRRFAVRSSSPSRRGRSSRDSGAGARGEAAAAGSTRS